MQTEMQSAPSEQTGVSANVPQYEQQHTTPPQDTTQQMPQDDLRSRVEAEKEIYRQKQLMKRKERELFEREQNLSKPKSIDDLLDQIVNSKDAEPEKKQEENLSHEEIIARAKQEIFEELQQQQQEYEYEQQTSQVQQEFTHDVGNFIMENADNFPLSAELGLHNQIAQEMIDQLQEIEEEYGEEYAEKWFNSIDWNQHISQYENTLAQNFKTMLNSERVRNLLRSYLGEETQVPSKEQPRTLSRENFSGNGGVKKSLQDMTVDERVAYAKAELRKQANLG